MLISQAEIDILEVLERAHPDHEASRWGGRFRDRIEQYARKAAKKFPGDLIEIGCYAGDTTLRIIKVAQEFGRKVICVDNWLPNTGYELDKVELVFRKQVEQYKDFVTIIKGDAHIEEIMKQIKQHNYCFALSDDGHSYNDHKTELDTLIPITNGLIAVDDVYLPEVRQAIADSLKQFPQWGVIYGVEMREAWLFKKN